MQAIEWMNRVNGEHRSPQLIPLQLKTSSWNTNATRVLCWHGRSKPFGSFAAGGARRCLPRVVNTNERLAVNFASPFFRLTAIAALAACALPVCAQWTLDNQASDLRFVTTKNTHIAEVQQFTRLSGELTPSGAVTLTIDLSSVETQVPIRNERLLTMLFEVAQHPTATFEGQVDIKRVAAMKPGSSADFDVEGQLSLHGKTQPAKAALRVVRLAGERLQVNTRAPILVKADAFDLAPGIEKLREIMSLPNIVGTVPVSFTLTFKK